MNKFLLFLPLFILCQHLSAQDVEAENLKQQISRHPKQDTVRVNRLIQLASISKAHPAEMEKLGNEALEISTRLGYAKGIGYALCAIGLAKYTNHEIEEAFKRLNAADSVSSLTKDPILRAKILDTWGLLNRSKDLKKAIEYHKEAEQIAEKTSDRRLLSDIQGNMANIYVISYSDYPKGMDYALKSLRSAEEANYLDGMVQSMRSIATVYTFLGDEQNSLLYYQKAVEVNKKLGNKDAEAILYLDIGESYRLAGKYPEALDSYVKSIALEKRLDLIEICESNMAEVYARMDSLPQAFKYGFSSLAKAEDIQDDAGIAWINCILSRAYLKKKMPDSAIHYASEGLQIASKIGSLEYRRDNVEALANAYAIKEDFKNAYKYHREFIGYRDSMVNATVANKSAVLRHDYDMEKQQAQINALNQQRKIQRNFLISALTVMALIVITAILLLRANRRQQKANTLLQQQKQEIDAKANELSIQKDNVELLGEIGRKINSSLSVEKIIGTVYDNVNSLMDATVFGIGIYNEQLTRIDFPATYENGKALPFYVNEVNDPNRLAVACFNSGKEIVMGNLQNDYEAFVQHMPTPREGEQPVSVIFLPLIAKGKKLGVITVQSFRENAYTDYHLYMLRNIAVYTAIALENAESYEELNHTVDSLKTTQAQLIQSEKMASLGELTAGIAHEIQNPLNFVNNFSEVSSELITEMVELAGNGNSAEVKNIADTIRQNLEKINFHGRRADAIVKGMMQHSRQTTGYKEPVDINALCDEYLRLTYHGLRAKDNLFNAELQTDFDASIGKIPVVPQDIGRVLINLFNNAFYAVSAKGADVAKDSSDKSTTADRHYRPIVLVQTKKVNHHIQITVKDNGNGIPQNIVNKIFQPFFTTKPSGQGTGLGLSLAYDIITKEHGGTIRVESESGKGAAFVITLGH